MQINKDVTTQQAGQNTLPPPKRAHPVDQDLRAKQECGQKLPKRPRIPAIDKHHRFPSRFTMAIVSVYRTPRTPFTVKVVSDQYQAAGAITLDKFPELKPIHTDR